MTLKMGEGQSSLQNIINTWKLQFEYIFFILFLLNVKLPEMRHTIPKYIRATTPPLSERKQSKKGKEKSTKTAIYSL